MLLDHNKFIVKAQTQGFSKKMSFQILEAESGQVMGTANDVTPFLSSLFGSTVIEVRDPADSNKVVMTVKRSGFLLKKDEVVDEAGVVVGRYKSKMFSLSGGFHIYDKDAKHIAEIQGKMLKAEYKFVTPDRTSYMGSVSRTWAGMAKSLLTGGDTHAVLIDPKFAADKTAKTLILGATIAIESIFKKKAGSSSTSE